MKNEQTANSIKVYNTAKDCLGEILSGNNPELGCAVTVNAIFKKALGFEIGGGASTALMLESLQSNGKFEAISLEMALPGDVIISPTGTSTLGSPHGHVGVVAKFGILSNSSEDGRLHEGYTLASWQRVFADSLGFPVFIFRVL